MGHSDQLTLDEYRANPLHPEIARRLDDHLAAMGGDPSALRVLDWGCGRGKDVLHLLEQGFDAHGVDIAGATIELGRALFQSMGHDLDERLSVMDGDNRTALDDDSVDFACSYYVFEHVADMASVARELARITRPGGMGLHVMPGKYRFMEGHLHMPLVHWLPKNRLRKALIRLCVGLGREPLWKEVAHKPASGRVDWYYRYIVNQTFYRSRAEVMGLFRDQGFTVRDMVLEHGRIQGGALGRFCPGPVLKALEPVLAGATSSVLLMRRD